MQPHLSVAFVGIRTRVANMTKRCLLLLVVGLVSYAGQGLAPAQQQDRRASLDDLFRRAGITRTGPVAASDFTLSDVSGKSFNLSAYRGNLVF